MLVNETVLILPNAKVNDSETPSALTSAQSQETSWTWGSNENVLILPKADVNVSETVKKKRINFQKKCLKFMNFIRQRDLAERLEKKKILPFSDRFLSSKWKALRETELAPAELHSEKRKKDERKHWDPASAKYPFTDWKIFEVKTDFGGRK